MDKETMKSVDDFMERLQLHVVDYFVNTVAPLCDEIINGDRPNWRMDIIRGTKSYFIDGKKITKWDVGLIMCIGTGGFPSEFDDKLIDKVQELYPSNCDYWLKVLLPTIRIWMLLTVCNISAPEARFYLDNGGEKIGKQFYKEFYRKKRT